MKKIIKKSNNMNWLQVWIQAGAGLILGGVVGGTVGAGIGAFIGAILGMALNGDEESEIFCPHCNSPLYINNYIKSNLFECENCKKMFVIEPTQEDLIYYMIGIMTKLGVNLNEIKKIIKQNFKIDELELNYIEETYKEAKNTDIPINNLADLLYSIIRNDKQFLEDFYALLFLLTLRNGTLNENIKQTLKKLLENFHLNNKLYTELIEEALKIKEAFEILGINPNNSFEEVKRKYKEKIYEFHPDKYVNLTQDEQLLIQEKAKKINSAYETLKKFYTNKE